MNKISLTILNIVFISVLSPLTAQIKFTGTDVELYVGQTLTVKAKPQNLQKYGLKGFIKTADTNRYSFDNCNTIVYCDGNFSSVYDSLINLKFICTKVLPTEGDYMKEKFLLQLYNEKTDTIYYRYESKYEHAFQLEVKGGIIPPEGYYCKDIYVEDDKFEGKRIFRSPILEPVSFEKYIEKEKTAYYLSLSTIGATPSHGQGVIILLENGEKIIKSTLETDVSVNSDAKFEHTAFIPLTQSDITKLKTHRITDFKLYIHEEHDINGHKYRDYLKCLLISK